MSVGIKGPNQSQKLGYIDLIFCGNCSQHINSQSIVAQSNKQ